MFEKIEAPADNLDEETKSIIDELKGGTEKTDEQAPKAEEKSEEKSQEEAKTEEEQADSTAKTEADPETTTPPDEGKEEEEKGKDDKQEPKIPRGVKALSLDKHKLVVENLKKKHDEEIAALKAQAQGVQTQTQGVEANDAIKKFAEKYQLPPEFASELVALIPKPTVPEDLKQKLEAFERERLEQQQVKAFNDEFSKDVLPLIQRDFPEVSQEEIDRLKTDISTLAFTEELKSTPLRMIYLGTEDLRPKTTAKKKSAEPSRGGSQQATTTLDFDSLTPQQVNELDDATFDKYSEYLASKGSKFTVIKR